MGACLATNEAKYKIDCTETGKNNFKEEIKRELEFTVTVKESSNEEELKE